MKRLLAVLLLLALLLPAAGLAAENSYQGKGFGTPEQAVAAYLDAMKAGDIQTAISTFAVESVIANMDPKAYITRMKVAMPNSFYWMPAENDISVGILTEMRRSEIANIIGKQYFRYSLIGTEYAETLGNMMTVVLKEESDADQFLETLRGNAFGEALSGMIVKNTYRTDDDTVRPMIPEHYFSERNQENIVKSTAYYGGDEVAEAMAVIEFDGTEYVQFMQCVRYGNKWFNLSQQSYLASLVGLEYNLGGLIELGEMPH